MHYFLNNNNNNVLIKTFPETIDCIDKVKTLKQGEKFKKYLNSQKRFKP